jgi:hypothetical protein
MKKSIKCILGGRNGNGSCGVHDDLKLKLEARSDKVRDHYIHRASRRNVLNVQAKWSENI